MKDWGGTFRILHAGGRQQRGAEARRAHTLRDARPLDARTHDFKVRSDGSHAAVTTNTKIQLFKGCSCMGKCRYEFH